MKKYKDKLKEKFLGDFLEGRFGSIAVYKNPQKLNNFPKGIRGIIDSKGNLYIWEGNENFFHIDAVELLVKNKFIKTPIVDLNKPKSGYLNAYLKFCCAVQEQYGKERGNFYISESYKIPYSKNITKEYLIKAKEKNPQFEFINMKITEVN
jgi:hypothetical protein